MKWGRLTEIRRPFCCRLVVAGLFIALVVAGGLDAELTAAREQGQPEEFFEKRIRPVLVSSCYECHTESAQGGLRVDSREALLRGGARGPAIVAGAAERSLLIAAVEHTHATLRMPKGAPRLGAQTLADLRQWIDAGAVWPATGPVRNSYAIRPEHRTHWAFQPLATPRIPAARGLAGEATTRIDAFLLAELEAKGLSFNPVADRRTLLRRVTFDLIGLPPTPEEIEAFAADRSAEALGRVVDRLLASPHYGERWGRHWLDVARYSDTLGMVDAGRNLQQWFPYAYTYRDWVVAALNADMPYNRFIEQQLAADQVPGNDRRHLAALGFLALSRGGLNVTREERTDDKVDVVSRGLLGLTVSCARCHNHKFDPIPTVDYYSLYTIFANIKEPDELPLLDESGGQTGRFAEEIAAERARIEAEIAERRQKRFPELLTLYRSAPEIARFLLGVHASRELKTEKEREKFAQEKDYNGFMLERWRGYLTRVGADEVWGIWNRLSALPEESFRERAGEALTGAVHPLVATAFRTIPGSLSEAAAIYGRLLAEYDKPEPVADRLAERLRQVLHGAGGPTQVAFADYEQIQLAVDAQEEKNRRRRIGNLFLKHAYQGAPPRAQAIEEVKDPEPGYVFVRGNSKNRGVPVEPQFLQILCDDERRPFEKGRERLELARAITAEGNPLTARVIVNRVWAWHFGSGLVATTSDFGTRGEAPTHPALLDHLAREFQAHGWSLKWLHRQIMLTRAYRQSADHHARAAAVDPENRLLWRFNRRRLEWEELRDSLLMTSGRLDRRMGGLPASAVAWPFLARRTIYSFIDRALVPSDFRVFDFASPDAHVPQRHLTTVPQQALLMMNSPFVHDQARALLERTLLERIGPAGPKESDEAGRITRMYRLVLGRQPTSEELELAVQFVCQTDRPVDEVRNEWRYGQGEYDEQAGRVVSFAEMPYFLNGQWRNSAMPGDPRDTTAVLHARGGLPGSGKDRTPIRRWIAPFDGRIRLSGTLAHNFENSCRKCEGMFGYVVSSRRGQLGRWQALQNTVATPLDEIEVMKGEQLDFVVVGGKGATNNEHGWRIVIERLAHDERWDSERDFRAPYEGRLSRWERLGQVLLMTAEFMTVE